jgi:predicted nuclease of restriction endonuclease-like (RecB) superfamily
MKKITKKATAKFKSDLYLRIRSILETARTTIARSVNSTQVVANWLVGREIVEEEQQGEFKAEYGKYVITALSERLQKDYGNGYSIQNLFYMRQFYVEYLHFIEPSKILHAVRGELGEKLHALRGELKKTTIERSKSDAMRRKSDTENNTLRDKPWQPGQLNPNLSWTHYRNLLKVKRSDARGFYEIEASNNNWSARQLERQINSLLFERLIKSCDKKGVMRLANKGQEINKPIDIIKDPMVIEFLGLPEFHQLVETKLETALISKLKDFLLELGGGFAFVGRQKRLTLDGDHFYTDLVFYHIKLKCYIIIDLKTKKLTHGDIGQMQMYVNFYDREIKGQDDNPTVGLIMCTEKNDAVVKYVLDKNQQQIFASKYQLELPSEKQLILELKKELNQLNLPETKKRARKTKREAK